MRNKIGNEEKDIIYLKEKIGSGSFGTIYKCSNNHDEELAVKIIKCKNGLPCLFEASIMSMMNMMSNIQHPYLNNAIKIHSNLEKLFIVQDLAISDLRKFRYYNNCDYTLMVDWIYSICQGIKYLHSKDIIHGDIKPNNILVYSDHTVKITDFNMSTKRTWNKKYQPCTNNYRPVEGWLNSLNSFNSFETDWDLPLDIWSLGCTIYYIKYGKSLFVSQDKDASINAIVEWSEYIGDKTNISKRRRFYYSPRIDMNFNNDNCQINELIKSILRIDPNNRPCIDDILDNKVFIPLINNNKQNNNKQNNIDNENNNKEIDEPEESIFIQITKKRIFADIRKFTEDQEIIEHTYDLYMKTRDLIYISDDTRLIVCLWIIHKIITRSPLALSSININYEYLLKLEKIVCEYLSYNIISVKNK